MAKTSVAGTNGGREGLPEFSDGTHTLRVVGPVQGRIEPLSSGRWQSVKEGPAFSERDSLAHVAPNFWKRIGKKTGGRREIDVVEKNLLRPGTLTVQDSPIDLKSL